MADFFAELTPRTDAISELTERVTAYLRDAHVDQRATHHVALVLEELLTNAATYGGAPATGVSVSMTVSPARVSGEVVDGGKMFDPSRERDADLSADTDKREVGGLGLVLIRRLTENLAYERVEGRNRTTFSIGRSPTC
jgi:anti-sigma regulatory factor (Ser/Thr protein kinase)